MSGEWRAMDTAPRDRQILLDVGLPWPVVGAYNPIHEGWGWANFNVGIFQGEYIDAYFENEHEKAPKFWREFPKLRGEK